MIASSATPPQPSRLGRLILFIRLVYRRMDEDGNFSQAAALTYSTLFSLLPTFVLALLVVSMFSSSGSLVQERLLRQLGLDQLQVQVGGEALDVPSFINERIKSVRALVQSPGTGLIAFATLVYGALSLMLVIERAFNRICRATTERTWARRIALYWSVLTLGPIAVAISLALSQTFHAIATSLVGPTQRVLGPVTLCASFAVSFGTVLLMYRLIPERPPRWRSALIGALVGAMLWELGKAAFGLYVRYSVSTRNWYGNLALLPLFMFWIYCTWNFLLLGLQVACCHQRFQTLVRQFQFGQSQAGALTDLRWILPLGVLLERRFRQAQALTPDEAAHALRISPDSAEQLLLALQSARLGHAVEGRAFALARPPEAITAGDLIDAARRVCHDIADRTGCPPTDPLFAPGLLAYGQLEDQWARATTLAVLSGQAPTQP